MNRLRFILLALLMVLLPLRGALGAVQACAGATSLALGQGAAQAEPAGAMDHQAHLQHMAHTGHSMQAAQAGASLHDVPADPGCSDCIALCCLLPLPMATLPALPALPSATACFAEPGAPAASFLCDGQERPPRS